MTAPTSQAFYTTLRRVQAVLKNATIFLCACQATKRRALCVERRCSAVQESESTGKERRTKSSIAVIEIKALHISAWHGQDKGPRRQGRINRGRTRYNMPVCSDEETTSSATLNHFREGFSPPSPGEKPTDSVVSTPRQDLPAGLIITAPQAPARTPSRTRRDHARDRNSLRSRRATG